MKFYITQYRIGRKLYGGKFFLISCIQLGMGSFWSDQEIKSCQAETLNTEEY